MSFNFLNWFKKESNTTISSVYELDIHSHLIPGIDDGVKDFDEAIEVILALKELGYKKFITTPHVMQGVYANTKAILIEKLANLNEVIKAKMIDVSIDVSAEYYVDEYFIDLLKTNKSELLPINNTYILIETGFLQKSPLLEEAVFLIQALGYKPLLAHPERYIYMHDDLKYYTKLKERGVLFQLNLTSLTGHYSVEVKRIANKLIELGYYDCAGSDCHGMRHVNLLKSAFQTDDYLKLTKRSVINSSI
jgi:protein-tyrosine phosphatase